MKPLFLEDHDKDDEKAVLARFADEWQASPETLKGFKVLVAYCSVGSWGCDSSAWYLLKKGRDLYEVSGSHCSCYGFEGQFSPERTNKAYLKDEKFSFSTGGYCSGGGSHIATVKNWIQENL